MDVGPTSWSCRNAPYENMKLAYACKKNIEMTSQMSKKQCTHGLDCEKNEFIIGIAWQTITCKYPGYNSTIRKFFCQGTTLHKVCGQTRQKLKNTQEHAMIVRWKGVKESTQIRTVF